MNENVKRYIGLDVHKHYLIALGVNVDLNVVLPARRVELFRLEAWMKKNLTKQDEVVLEMTTNTWQLYDELIQYVGKVTVVHPPHVALITRSQVMNDKIAASILARLLAKGLLVGIWIPPQEIREVRGLVAQRQKLVRLGTQAKNRLHAVIQRHHLVPPAGNPFGARNKEWWMSLSLGKLEKLNLQSDLETLQFAEKQVKDMTEIMEGMAAEQEEIGRLLHLAGFGVVMTMIVLSAIGDIHRFESAKYLVGYAGLGAGIHESGKEHIEKRITKSGRKELRWALVEAAWQAIRISPYWKEQYEKYLRRMRRPNQAIVVIARKLLVAVWQVLTKEETDVHASEEDLAYKMLVLAWDLDEDVRMGLTYKQFAKYALMKLGVETDITRFVRKNVPRRVAPREEVLARMEELGLTC
jgi:transposase